MLSFITWNVHSINNKCHEVMEHVLDHNADIVFLTETWLESEKNHITATLKDYGYTLYHKTRTHDTKSRGEVLGYCVQVDLILREEI